MPHTTVRAANNREKSASARRELMLADDCCAVAVILESPEHWRVPEVSPEGPLLAAMSQSVAAADGERHVSLRRVTREGIQEAVKHVTVIIESVLSEMPLPLVGELDLVQEFIAPVIFRVKACLLGDRRLSSTVACWSAMMFGGTWEPAHPIAESPAAVITYLWSRPGPPIARWQDCIANGRMTYEELEGATLIFAVAGNDAVIAGTAGCVAKLAEDAGLQRRLREHRALLRAFVTDAIASEPPVRYTFRVGPEDRLTVVSLDARKRGQSCPAHGDRFAAPFGRGVHSCLGAELGLELAIGTMDAILSRTAWITSSKAPTRHPNDMFQGFVRLPVVLQADEGEGTVAC